MDKFRSLNIDVVIGNEAKRITGAQRTEFVNFYGFDDLIPGRYSEVLIVDVMMNDYLNGISPMCVVDEIKRLESSVEEGYTKDPIQFNRNPLHPLWHQHYFSAHYLPTNIKNEMNKNFNAVWDRSMGVEGSAIEEKNMGDLMHAILHENIETRSNEKRMTGEWLVFSKQTTGNIYLCAATHTTGDQNIYNKVKYCCELQFPLLEPFASDCRKNN